MLWCEGGREGAGGAVGAVMATGGGHFPSFFPRVGLAEAGGLLCHWAELGGLKYLFSVLHLVQVLSLISSPEKLGQLQHRKENLSLH